MGFIFTFKQIQNTQDIRELVDFIAAQNLGYPNYDLWIQRTEEALLTEQKKAVLAYSRRTLVGDLIYQEHKTIPGLIELKNLRIHPSMRLRDFAGFMIKQTEKEAEKQGYQGIIADTRPTRKDIINFLHTRKYQPVITGPLYDPNQEDITFMKTLTKNKEIILVGKEYLRKNLV